MRFKASIQVDQVCQLLIMVAGKFVTPETSFLARLYTADAAMRSYTRKHRHTHKRAHGEKGRREVNVLFNDALNTFYLRLYGV